MGSALAGNEIARMTRRLALVLGALVLGPAGAAGSAAPTATPPPPSDFATRIDNPWFPLRPGTTMVYRGEEDGEPVRQVVRVTSRTKVLQGVRCVVLDDRVYRSGRLQERTNDWYAQDKRGTVWYFGEATAELDEQGHVVSTEGSWQAGRDGARAGVYMPAHPRVGQTFRQEYYPGHAEDFFRIVSLRATVRVPYVTSTHALQTREWTPLEPGVVDRKLYVRGIGTVKEATIKGGNERVALVAVRRS
jgi:hypothetical protein